MRVLKILCSMPRLCYLVLEAGGKVSQPILPPEVAREALPCLSRALKYWFRAPLIPENTVPLEISPYQLIPNVLWFYISGSLQVLCGVPV